MTRLEKAAEAVREFNRMLPRLQSYVRAITEDPTIRVAAGETTMTDGRTVFIRPPMVLAEKADHDRRVCDTRGEDFALLCPECARMESVYTSVYHEVAHIAYGSFKTLEMKSVTDAMNSAMMEHASEDFLTHYRGVLGKILGKHGPNARTPAMEAAQLVAPELGPLLMATEDARVDAAVGQVRPGVADARWSKGEQIMRKGIEQKDGSFLRWLETPVEAQVAVATLWTLGGHDVTGAVDPEVLKAVQYAPIAEILSEIPSSLTDSVKMAMKLLAELHKLGLYDLPVPPPPMPTPEPDESDRSEDTEPEDSEDNDPQEENSEESDDESDDDGNGCSVNDSDPGEPGDDPNSADEQQDSAEDGGDNSGEGGDNDSETNESNEQESSDSDSLDEKGDDGAEPKNADGSGDETGSGSSDFEDGEQESGSGDLDNSVSDADGIGNDPGTSERNDPLDTEDRSDSHGGDLDSGDGSASLAEEEISADNLDIPNFRDTPSASVEEVEAAMESASGHEEIAGLHDDDLKSGEMQMAINQVEYFDTVTPNVLGVRVFRNMDDPDADSWAFRHHPKAVREMATIHSRMSGKTTMAMGDPANMHQAVPEASLAGAVMRARAVFAKSSRDKMERDLKSGKINSRVLGARAWKGDDDRLFQRRTIAEGISYEVVIGLDISGSTFGGAIVIIKQAGEALANVLHRIKIPFSIYAHTTPLEVARSGMHQDMYEIKSVRDPWSREQKTKLASLIPVNGSLDGHNLQFYRKVLDRSQAKNRLALYFTDGSIPATNRKEEGPLMRDEVRKMERSGHRVLGVGVGTDSPKQFGLDTVSISSGHDIVTLIKALEVRLTGNHRS